MSRYDRREKGGRLERVHQEDFCQALGFDHSQKYQDEGGPGLKECLSLLQESSSDPILDKRNLLRWVAFNYLVGNCDAHAKNASLLITRAGIRLAPFYDLMSTVIYKGLAQTLAMNIGGENRPDRVMKRHWERLAQAAEVGTKAVAGICLEMAEAAPSAVAELAARFREQYGESEEISQVVTYALSMSERLAASFRREGPA